MKRIHLLLVSGLALIAVALVPSLALAAGGRTGTDVTLAKGVTHHGTFYAAGRTVSIEGNVDGDLVCAGRSVTVDGSVSGDVLCAGQTVSINGPVGGSVRVVAQDLTVDGSVGHNVTVAAQTFTLGSSAKVTGELGLLGQTATVHGSVGQNLYGALASLTLGSTVGGNVDTRLSDLSLSSGAHITGHLSYTSPNSLAIDTTKVGGAVTYHQPPHQAAPSPRASFLAWLSGRLFWILATLAVALTLVGVVPRALQNVTATMARRPGASIGWGVLLMFVAPVGLIVLLFTVIGIPLALILAGGWILALALSSAVIAITVGRWLLSRAHWQADSLAWAAVAGTILTVVVFGVPLIGGLLSLVATWWALGALALGLHPASQSGRAKPAAPAKS